RDRLVAALRPHVALELHYVAGRGGDHEGHVLVGTVRESNGRADQELDAQLLDVTRQPGEVLHAQEGQAVVPRVGTRIGRDRAPLQVAYQLQNAAKAEGNAVLEDAHRLRAEDARVPLCGLLEVAAGHRDMRDVALAGRDLRVVQ